MRHRLLGSSGLGFPHDFLANPPIRELVHGGAFESLDPRRR